MFIGIDVGGTHTDGVLITEECLSDFKSKYKIVSTAKVVTERGNLMNSIVGVLDSLILGKKPEEIKRIVLSTTIAVNAILEEKYESVGLILIPGTGMNPEYLKYGEENIILSGYVNHRGKQVKPLNEAEIIRGLDKLEAKGIKNLAIVGKFSIRNPEQEEKVISLIKKGSYSFQNIVAGHQLSGRLGFPRRVITAYFNSAITPIYRDFITAITKALRERNINADVFVLKCDGGTVSLENSLQIPIETVNSGPAASIIGTMTLTSVNQNRETAIVLDMGGTTTDIGFFINGEPAFMPGGIEINGLPTLVRGLYNVSIPLGGDSKITVEKGRLKIGPQRHGSAVACGGSVPTPTDAMLLLGYLQDDEYYEKDFDIEAARRALTLLLTELDFAEYPDYFHHKNGDNLNALAELIVDLMTDTIVKTIKDILVRLDNQAVYTISELLTDISIKPEFLLVMGGPANALVDILAEKLHYRADLVPHTKVANAVGAAIARPTLMTTVRIDTATSYLDIVEAGIHRHLKRGEGFDIAETEEFAKNWTKEKAGNEEVVVEITDSESFNVIRGFRTLGKIMEVKAQIKPGPIAWIGGISDEKNKSIKG